MSVSLLGSSEAVVIILLSGARPLKETFQSISLFRELKNRINKRFPQFQEPWGKKSKIHRTCYGEQL